MESMSALLLKTFYTGPSCNKVRKGNKWCLSSGSLSADLKQKFKCHFS
jgi:hypothetical protein